MLGNSTELNENGLTKCCNAQTDRAFTAEKLLDDLECSICGNWVIDSDGNRIKRK